MSTISAMKNNFWLLAAFSLFVLGSTPVSAADLPNGPELLSRSIGYHDPDGLWGRTPLTLTVEGTRPDGPPRTTEIGIDLAAQVFTWATMRDGHELAARVEGDLVEATMDGSSEIPVEASEKYRLSAEDVRRKRDYYTYLWGLPMKLRDPGARVGESVLVTEFQGAEVLALRVTYDEEVGRDIWYFYFEPSTAALVGYRFFHDEAKNDGEYITTDGEVRVGGLLLPDNRAWYYNKDDGYLGKDSLLFPAGN